MYRDHGSSGGSQVWHRYGHVEHYMLRPQQIQKIPMVFPIVQSCDADAIFSPLNFRGHGSYTMVSGLAYFTL